MQEQDSIVRQNKKMPASAPIGALKSDGRQAGDVLAEIEGGDLDYTRHPSKIPKITEFAASPTGSGQEILTINNAWQYDFISIQQTSGGQPIELFASNDGWTTASQVPLEGVLAVANQVTSSEMGFRPNFKADAYRLVSTASGAVSGEVRLGKL